MFLLTEDKLSIGQETVVDSFPASIDKGVVFEDDGQTGYFYAIEKSDATALMILDAVHVYDVASVVHKNVPSEIKIFWTDDLSKSALIINDYCHAIIDFKNEIGLCRNGFPESKNWTRRQRKLTDKEVEQFFRE